MARQPCRWPASPVIVSSGGSSSEAFRREGGIGRRWQRYLPGGWQRAGVRPPACRRGHVTNQLQWCLLLRLSCPVPPATRDAPPPHTPAGHPTPPPAGRPPARPPFPRPAYPGGGFGAVRPAGVECRACGRKSGSRCRRGGKRGPDGRGRRRCPAGPGPCLQCPGQAVPCGCGCSKGWGWGEGSACSVGRRSASCAGIATDANCLAARRGGGRPGQVVVVVVAEAGPGTGSERGCGPRGGSSGGTSVRPWQSCTSMGTTWNSTSSSLPALVRIHGTGDVRSSSTHDWTGQSLAIQPPPPGGPCPPPHPRLPLLPTPPLPRPSPLRASSPS